MPVAVTDGTIMAGQPLELAGELPARFDLDCLRAGIGPARRSAATR